jgi:hypothetical protein
MGAFVKTCGERYGKGQGASKGIQARQNVARRKQAGLSPKIEKLPVVGGTDVREFPLCPERRDWVRVERPTRPFCRATSPTAVRTTLSLNREFTIHLQPIQNFSLGGVFSIVMKRAIQFATVAFSLSMLAAFVANSDQKAGRPAAHSKRGPAGISTNATPHHAPEPAVAPGSKSLAPLVRPPLTSVTNMQRGITAPFVGQGGRENGTVAWGSKYGRVLTPTQLAPDSTGIPSVPPPTNAARRATSRSVFAPGSKSAAPVITLRPEYFVAPQTNPPPRKTGP